MNPRGEFERNDFDFPIPDELVAHEPLADKERGRLAVFRSGESIAHQHIADLERLIPSDALVLVNNSRVIPSRLLGHLSTGGRFEILLLEPTDGSTHDTCEWLALARPLRKLRPGTRVPLPGNLEAIITGRAETAGEGPGTVSVRFPLSPAAFESWQTQHGYVPLPPYISRPDPKPVSESSDSGWYQTIYAKPSGSAAAPTAGLHFTPRLMRALGDRGVTFGEVTLHVGAGTFLPVRDDDIDRHVMHEERYMITAETLAAIRSAVDAKRPIIGVGTTTLRTLESFYRAASGDPERMDALAGQWLRTDLFIRPRRATDRVRPWPLTGLMTNFHQPSSTLLMLVCALIGYENAKALYAEAVRERYRFFSYGDACLLWL